MRLFACIGLVSACLVSGSALAATLSSVSGTVSVGRSEGYTPAVAGSVVAIGDRILVGKDGKASVVFRDGCQVTLKPAQILTISNASPCFGGSASSRLELSGRMGQATTGPAPEVPAICGPLTIEQCVGAGLVTAAGATALGFAIAGGGDNSRPASP